MWTHLLRHWFRWDLVRISLGSRLVPLIFVHRFRCQELNCGGRLAGIAGRDPARSCAPRICQCFLFRFCSDRLSMFKQTFRWLYDWCDDLIHFLIHLSSIFPEILPAWPRKAWRSRAIWWAVGTCWNIPADQIIHLVRPDYATLCKGTFIDNHDTYQLAIVKNSGYSCKMINRTCSILKQDIWRFGLPSVTHALVGNWFGLLDVSEPV